jgi:DNA-binding transcriptional ArsR family regulator
MLRVFTEIAQDSEYLVVHENCGAATRFDQLFRSVAGQIPLLYYGGLSPADSQSAERSSLADLLTDGPNGPNEISRLLAELSGTRSIIVLDEFDRVEDPSFQRDIAELIKNLSDASARVQLVIAGVADNLQELLGHSPSIRRNIIGIAIDRMSDAEVAQIIEIGERHAGVSFDRATKDRLVELALGRPYLTRLLAHHASIAAADRGSGQVENVDLEAALDRAARETQSQLAERTRHAARQSLAENRSAILGVARASLANGGEFTAQELATATGESPAQVEGRIRELLSAHLLEARADEAEISYRFVEESLATYLVLAADSREAQLRG